MNFISNAITTQLNAALNQIFQQGLINQQSDDLTLKTLRLIPLNDDPIQAAPYVVYGPMRKIGRTPVKDPLMGGFEIGGPSLWLQPYQAVLGTPRAETREEADDAINELTRRVETLVMGHFDLADVLAPGLLKSPDGAEWIDAMDPEKMWLRSLPRTFGGDTEWYGQCLCLWYYTYHRRPNWPLS